MRLLLMAVLLLGLLHRGIQEAFQSNFPMKSFPVLVKGPFGNEKPIVYTYYTPHGLRGANPRGPPIPFQSSADVEPDIYGIQDGYAIDRSHLFPLRNEGPIPLRDSVEKLPIEAKMSILRKSVESNENDIVGFSRADVEALPAPKITSYASTRDSENLAMMYSSQDYQGDDSLIGYRKDVESPPKSPNINPFLAFYPELNQRFTNFENSWKPQTVFQPKPLEYKSWSRPFHLRSPSEKKVVCYYESWAALRPEPAMFDIKHIDPFACSHLIYSFAGLHNDTYEIVSLDHARDVIQGAYKSAVALKLSNPKLKVMIAVGGWAEGGMKYSNMVSSQAKRDAFVNSVTKFIANHGFDGLDLDWEYPGASDRGGKNTDKDNLSILVEQLHAIFQPKGWILSMAIPPVKTRLDEGYDLGRLSKSLDFFNVMTYDLRGPWDGFADHHAPFLPKPTDKYIHKELNMKDGLQSLVDYGIPKSKIIVGLPFYGRSFTLETPDTREKHPKITGTGMEGKYTMEKGYLAYFEICKLQMDGGWFVDIDEAGGPYMIKGNQWIGYDNEESLEAKVNFAKHEDFGGLMMWALDLDDFQGLCGSRWPLMSVIRSVLFSPKTPGYQPMITPSPSGIFTEKPTTVRKPAATTRPTMIEVEQPRGPSAGEACTGSKMMGKPGSCSDFLICNQGQWLEKSCAPGLHWNEENKNCDWPEKANCDQSKPPVVVGSYPVQVDKPKPPSISQFPKPGHTTLEQAPTAGPLSGDYMVVCYYTNWARYRPNQGKYVPSNIDTSTCTHIVYGFAVLDFNTLLIKPHDSWADIDLKGYQEVTALKARGMKVTLAIGGWNDSTGDKYNRLFLDPGARRRFVTHVVEFLLMHNFDGLDLDYEYPVCKQTKCSDGDPREKAAFAALCQELSAAFKPKNLLLSAAVSPSKKIIDTGYDVKAVNRYLDWIAVMTYDFHGHWDKKTGHVAPMYYHPEDDFDYFNMDFAIRYWIEKGASPKKIVVGMPLYGQSFTLNDPNVHGLNAPANAKGLAGKYTRAAGFLAYYEICKHIQEDGWTVVKDPKGRMGPYAYHGNQWVSFDDVDTIRKKSNYIREMGLGGGMIWALDLDDFTNMCSQGAYPLLKTIQAVLGPAKDSTVPSLIGHTKPRPSTEVALPTPPVDAGGIIKPIGAKEDLKVVCYFTSWASYRPGEGKYTPADIQPELCTHLIYGFVVLDEATLTLKPLDKWLDVDKNYIENIVKLKNRNRNLKVLAALGGWNDSKGSKYSDLVHDPQARKRFNEHAIHFLTHYQLDGLDIDWEYPGCYQADCSKGKETDKDRFVEWISELSMLFKPRGLLLSAAVASNYKIIAKAYDVSMLSRYLDFINLMTYDYHGQWDKKTGHFSPLYIHPDDDEHKFNTDFTVKYWIQKGADPRKLIMGLGMYGQSFTLVSSHLNGLNQPTKSGGDAGPYTKAKGFLAYYEICYFIKRQGWTVVRDPQGRMGPYAYKNNQWVGFDDIPMIRKKSEYIRNMGLGGGMIWALDLDDFNNRCSCENHPLLRTVNRVLRPSSYTVAEPACPLLGTEKQTVLPSPPIQITTTRIVPTLPADSSIGTEGASCNDGEFRRHSDCNKFFECFKGKLRALSCYGTLHWDGRGKCVHPTKAGCKGHVSSPVSIKQETPEPQIHVKPRPRPSPPPHPPLHDVSGDFGEPGQACKAGFKRHPTDCNKFFECLHNKLEERKCFPGLQWDGEGRCTWPNQANCVTAQGTGISPVPGQGGQVPPQAYTTSRPMTTRRYTTTRTFIPSRRTTTTKRPTTRKPPRSSTQWYVPWTPSTASTTPRPTHPPGPLTTDGKMIVCYFTNWAWYRRGDGKYIPEDIDADLCTHILYGFAVLDSNKYIIKAHDSWADYDNKFYERVTGFKAKGKKVILALGGWNDSKGGKYSKLVNSPALRAKFIAHAVEFLEKYNFDGLDLDWEYPKCWQVDCSKGPDSDKDAFSAWIRELSAALKPRNMLLSAAISPSKVVIEQAYHVPDLSRYMDFINVMTYDFHGHWDKQTGHVAPLYHHEESTNEFFNANYTINFLIEKGADRKKLCMGMPMYGQAFTLNDAKNQGLNSPARKGAAGKYTRAAGFLAYYEICNKIKNEGYTVVKDPLSRIGPYAYKDRQWVGFDDSDMIRRKSQYVMDMGLGGGMIWALDLDDFRNVCNCEAHPLLRTMARVLRGYNKHPEPNPDCSL